MKRNIYKTMENGRKHIKRQADLKMSEIDELINFGMMYQNRQHGLYETICMAFYFGFEVGRKSQKKEGKSNGKTEKI